MLGTRNTENSREASAREAGARNLDWRTCVRCGDDIHSSRWALGYHLCLFCGEEHSIQERRSWCVSIPYSKGAYQLITNPADLLDTNPKQPRG